MFHPHAEIVTAAGMFIKDGAGDGNRTHVASLGSWSSTIELHPPVSLSHCIVPVFSPVVNTDSKILPIFQAKPAYALAKRKRAHLSKLLRPSNLLKQKSSGRFVPQKRKKTVAFARKHDIMQNSIYFFTGKGHNYESQ